MKFDPVILGMTKGDIAIVISTVLRNHLACECVDRSDLDIWADHLGEEVAAILETPPDVDGSWAEFARSILH